MVRMGLWRWIWRRGLAQNNAGPTNVSSILAAIVFLILFIFRLRRAPGVMALWWTSFGDITCVAPCGREQGAKWDHIRVGSYPGGIISG